MHWCRKHGYTRCWCIHEISEWNTHNVMFCFEISVNMAPEHPFTKSSVLHVRERKRENYCMHVSMYKLEYSANALV